MIPYPFQDLATAPTPDRESGAIFEALQRSRDDSGWSPLPVRSITPAPTPEPPRADVDAAEADPPEQPQEAHAEPPPGPTIDRSELDRLKAAARKQGQLAGHAEGHAAGFSAGEAEGRASWEERIQRAEALVTGLADAQANLFEAVKGDLVRLITHIPQKILRQELSARPEAVVGLAEALIREIPRQRQLILRAHPEDAGLIREAGLRSRDGGALKVEEDANLNRGDVVLVTDAGDIDATIGRQLDNFARQASAWLTGEEAPTPPNEGDAR